MMDDYLAEISAEEQKVFTAIADYVLSLGYKAKKDATGNLGYTFRHPHIKKTIVRFTMARNRPIVRFKFYVSHEYSVFFHEAIRATIEEYNYKYTGCYHCGHCNGTQGYTYRYPDGRQYFRCGAELIELFDVIHIPMDEFQSLFNTQHAFYLAQKHKR